MERSAGECRRALLRSGGRQQGSRRRRHVCRADESGHVVGLREIESQYGQTLGRSHVREGEVEAGSVVLRGSIEAPAAGGGRKVGKAAGHRKGPYASGRLWLARVERIGFDLNRVVRRRVQERGGDARLSV